MVGDAGPGALLSPSRLSSPLSSPPHGDAWWEMTGDTTGTLDRQHPDHVTLNVTHSNHRANSHDLLCAVQCVVQRSPRITRR